MRAKKRGMGMGWRDLDRDERGIERRRDERGSGVERQSERHRKRGMREGWRERLRDAQGDGERKEEGEIREERA